MKQIVRFLALAALILMPTAMVFARGQQAKAAPARPITWWTLSGGGGDVRNENFRRQVIADYQRLHPNVNFELTVLENEAFKQRIQVAIQAGTPPDIFQSWGGGVMIEFARAGMLRDITDVVRNEISKTIGMGALGVYGYDGRFFGAPYDMGAVGFWYNRRIFREVGIAVPETWDQLLAAIPRLRAAGHVPIALGGGDKWPAHFWWVYLAMRVGGQEAFNAAYGGRGSFRDQPFVRAGELLVQLRNLNPFQTGFLGATYDDQAALMGNARAAMELMGQWAPTVQASNSVGGAGIGADLGWFPFPAVAGGRGRLTDVMGGGNGYVLGKNAPDQAVDFLRFFLRREYNEQLIAVQGIVPVVAGAEAGVTDPNLKRIIEAVKGAGYFQLYYDQFLPPAVGATVNDAVVGLLAGALTPAQVASQIDAAWQAAR